MNNFSGTHMRSRRNILDLNGFTPIHFPRSNYSTDAQMKTDMKLSFGDDQLFNRIHLLPDPLKKNLADSVITGETKKKMVETKEYPAKEAVTPPPAQRTDYYPTLAGITSFFSGVFNIMGNIFHKRASSPASQYYDCFDKDYDEQMAQQMFWQPPNFEVQNKNDQVNALFGNDDSSTNLDVDMNVDCRNAATQCEDKLNQVRLLLTQKNVQNISKPKTKETRRPRKAFIEAGSVEENFEDAFSPENFVSLANDPFIEYYSPFNCHDDLLIESDAPHIKTSCSPYSCCDDYTEPDQPKSKTDLYVNETMDIAKTIPENNQINEPVSKVDLEKDHSNDDITKKKDEIISSCEDKLSKLKALLQSKRCKKSKEETTAPIPIPDQNKIETLFGNEMSSSDLQSNSSHNSDCFNEVTGRFNSSSVDSEDSFQIVFTDSPQNIRRRIPSDCESEDSFIVFEESPDSCYTSNEVFGDDNDDDDSDTDSNNEEDSGCGVYKLSPGLSRTFGDLTDNSLYGQDVVDSCKVSDEPITTAAAVGLLLDERRKSEKKKLPAKKVTFSEKPPKVHVMRVWSFAARQARAGHWERHALDRERFRRRIADVEMAISWVLKPQHRSRVVFQRFMPWWNAQKRKELAEKKEREHRQKEQSIRDREDDKKHCDNKVEINDDVKEDAEEDKDLANDGNKVPKDVVGVENEVDSQVESIRDQSDWKVIEDANKIIAVTNNLLLKDSCIDT